MVGVLITMPKKPAPTQLSTAEPATHMKTVLNSLGLPSRRCSRWFFMASTIIRASGRGSRAEKIPPMAIQYSSSPWNQ